MLHPSLFLTNHLPCAGVLGAQACGSMGRVTQEEPLAPRSYRPGSYRHPLRGRLSPRIAIVARSSERPHKGRPRRSRGTPREGGR